MITRKFSSVSVLVCVLWFLQAGNYVQPIRIECIPLSHCPLAMKLLKTRPISPETKQFLRLSQCGQPDGEQTKIWCALLDTCTTPDNKNGTCEPIKECDSYLKYISTVDLTDPVVKKYLKAFQCTSEFDSGPGVKVCCAGDVKHDGAAGTEMTADDVHNRFFHRGAGSTSTLPKSEDGECGQQNSDNRIVGGSDTYLDEYPWMALLKYVDKNRTRFACSGSLISNQYVLTAAHCVDPEIIRRKGVGRLVSVVLGEYDTRNETDCIYQKYGSDCADPPQEIRIDSYVTHPEYNSKIMINDIAIIRLGTKVKFSDYVQPICLPRKNMKLEGSETFMISGWGRTETQNPSPVKRKARVNYVDKENCNRFKRSQSLNERQICAGEGNGTDTCYGDSGGPLMLDVRNGFGISTFIVGTVSYGYGTVCGATPGVYTFIPSFIDWIQANTN